MKNLYSNMKFKKYIIMYLEREKDFVKESSFAIYSAHTYNKIIPFFGEYRLSELNNNLVQEFCTKLLLNGNAKNGNGLSVKTTKDILIFFNSSLEFLFKQNIIKSFDTQVRINKSQAKKEIITFNDREIISIRDYLKFNLEKRNLGILIAMFSGLRIGEICALKWEDIDINNNVININKTLQRINTISKDGRTSMLKVSSPKSSKSNRSIPINVEIINCIENFSEKKGYLLTSTNNPLEPRALRYHFDSILKKLHINKRPFHSLRHTFATRLIKNTNDFKTVSELLGHSSISITLDIYTHTSEETKINCINKY